MLFHNPIRPGLPLPLGGDEVVAAHLLEIVAERPFGPLVVDFLAVRLVEGVRSHTVSLGDEVVQLPLVRGELFEALAADLRFRLRGSLAEHFVRNRGRPSPVGRLCGRSERADGDACVAGGCVRNPPEMAVPDGLLVKPPAPGLRGWRREHHFYSLLLSADWLTTDDHAFLTDQIIAFFDHNYAAALHLGVARLEEMIARTIEAEGEPVTNFQGEQSEQRTLSGLLHQVRGDVDANFVEYLNYKYVQQRVGQLG